MVTSTLTIRIEDDLMLEATEVADCYGLDLSSITLALYRQMVNTRSIPLTFAPVEPMPRASRPFVMVTPS